MVTVLNNYKLIDIEGTIHEIDTKEAWGVVEVQFNAEKVTINEGDQIEFTVEDSGEIKQGTVLKIKGSKAKTKLEIKPFRQNCQETWEVAVMAEGSLKVIGKEDEE